MMGQMLYTQGIGFSYTGWSTSVGEPYALEDTFCGNILSL